MCRLTKHFGGGKANWDFVLDDLPMDQGWAIYAWVIQNDGWLQFSGLQMDDDGYIMQGAKQMAKEAMKSLKR